ncbi:dTDP-4-dehydrorhamnose reductase [Arthrobacter sp. CAN_C5]|uniref:dTDP-4-dehydrorhamnose reductase n=1 Tax=Arthrobacter sp. CAN_C5 TaxID=2760706 RepID=UPI001AE7731E|nr:dTDP-4-dehydrorhamnose reductase [Arthrobacter sp. CAN_C5]MBP2215939.1 dTDP-4-dehydrorhamnose 3,5-epimerase [Arthrobacter sp. CAN_C5]
MSELSLVETPIPGLMLITLPVHGDGRGWFKENWQREKMVALGLPDFGPVQNNISYNATAGTTRGIHAEPWDKFVTVATGRVFGAWVDLREGPGFGTVFTTEIDEAVAIFVPRGVGNAFQTLEKDTVYNYLVNDHWSPDAVDQYVLVNLADETLDIQWPLPLGQAEVSAKDRDHPRLTAVRPVPPRTTLVLGADGQLGRALRVMLPDAEFSTRRDFDLADEASYDRDWSRYSVIINAAAYTDVDGAETTDGRRRAWAINAVAPARLAQIAAAHRITLVHVSTDYVFDGVENSYLDDAPPSPLGVYGQSKAAGDLAVCTAAPQHYLVRTSWVIGEGRNFVRTMAALAARGVSPTVVNDQIGRPTFAGDLAAAILHLIDSSAAFGTYNMSNAGTPLSWADLARVVYQRAGADPGQVVDVTAKEYFLNQDAAPRPAKSVLDLTKLEASGFQPRDWADALAGYPVRATD